jgi:hypothetical protein
MGTLAARALAGTNLAVSMGLRAPAVLMLGHEGFLGRALLVTDGVPGTILPRFLAECDFRTRHDLLRRLGGEVARFPRTGLIHGDMTPFNIFVARDEPPGFVFIDHERTRRASRTNRWRQQLRNLVQLGRFHSDFVSRTDRMRVFTAWAAGLSPAQRRAGLARIIRMLDARVRKDRGFVRITSSGEITIIGSAEWRKPKRSGERWSG